MFDIFIFKGVSILCNYLKSGDEISRIFSFQTFFPLFLLWPMRGFFNLSSSSLYLAPLFTPLFFFSLHYNKSLSPWYTIWHIYYPLLYKRMQFLPQNKRERTEREKKKENEKRAVVAVLLFLSLFPFIVAIVAVREPENTQGMAIVADRAHLVTEMSTLQFR